MPPNTVLPDVRIEINGTRVPTRFTDDIISVTVQDDLDAVSMFAIEVSNWHYEQLRVTWSDHRSFVPGAEVAIAMGFLGTAPVHVMTGEITSLEPSFAAGAPARLVIRGFDQAHRLQRGRKTRSFVRMKESQIAGRIGTEAGLKVVAKDSKTVLEYVVQHNQTDWAFLLERGARVGYVLRCRDGNVHFEPPNLTAQPVETLRLSDDVDSFRARLSGRLTAEKHTVTGWNVTNKEALTGVASAGQQPRIAPGGGDGLRSVAKAFGGAATADIEAGPRTKAEADAIAKAHLTAESLQVVTGELVCQGRPRVHAGDLVTIAEAGTRFSGPYLVTGVTHTLDTARGFRTRLLVRSNSV